MIFTGHACARVTQRTNTSTEVLGKLLAKKLYILLGSAWYKHPVTKKSCLSAFLLLYAPDADACVVLVVNDKMTKVITALKSSFTLPKNVKPARRCLERQIRVVTVDATLFDPIV